MAASINIITYMASPIRPFSRRLHLATTFTYSEPRPFLALGNQINGPTQVNMLEINSNLKGLIKTGYLEEARNVFDKLRSRDIVSWTTLISGYVNASDCSEALSLFSKMWVDPDLEKDPYVLSIALKACGFGSNVRYGESLHGFCVKTGLINSVFVGSSMVDMYAKTGRVWEGCRVFDEMPLRNVVSWTALITGLVHAGYSNEGLRYFSELLKSGEDYDSYTFAIALKACADTGSLNHGRELHTQAMKRGFDTTSFVANTLATMYNKCGKLDYGICLFERMAIKDVVSWTTIITSCFHLGQDHYAIQAFLRMRGSGICPNEYTFAALISSCANLTRLDWGEQLHAHVQLVGFIDFLSVANSIMTLYSRFGMLNSALSIFHGMFTRDIVSWSTIIAGYAQGGFGEEAFEFLSLMRREGPKPTEFALASVLSVCGNMAILEQGKQLHTHILLIGLEHRAMVRSGLINMYSKCGSLMEASKVFYDKPTNDIVSWTAMINGYAEHGKSKEAIDLFEKITQAGLRPDSVTFIGVLSACNHAGLVDLGFHYFELINKKYKLFPSKEHYGCMIDLLCRAGRLSDAESMIRSMPCTKDDVVWSTLLRACREQGDVDRAQRIADIILELDPNCAATHITLANTYSAKGKWGEAAIIRKMMRSKGVMKEPGWSWIKLKDRVLSFVAGDRSHPEGDTIYGILDLIASRGDVNVEDTEIILYDNEDVPKVKLAFADL